MTTDVFLSIVIPTKNRQFTCLYAIESVVAIEQSDIEIIVQDCSDTDILRNQILEKFGTDRRIKYEYTDKKPSLTDNLNNAFNRASGEYLCAIGDDDAVIPVIYEFAEWARLNQILAITQKEFIFYCWPGFTPQPFNGTLTLNKNYSEGRVVINDLTQKVLAYSKLINPMGYMSFPQAYHCIFSKKIKQQLEDLTGSFLQSTAFDVYSAIAFNKFVKSYIQADAPFTIRGASKNSNSQRLFVGRSKEHFSEYVNIIYPEILPDSFGLCITVAESFINACKSTGQEELINNIDLPMLYANIALQDKKSFKACKKKLYEYVHSIDERRRFNQHFYGTKRKQLVANFKKNTFSFIKKVTPFLYKSYRKLFPLQIVSKTIILHAENIKDALAFIKKNNFK